MKWSKTLLLLLGTGIVLSVPGLAAADVNDFTVTSFTADETLSRADPQGQLHIIERLDVAFTAQNHGILRAIPKTYHSHPLQLHVNRITSTTSAPVDYTTYGSNGNTVLKIGNANQTVTGHQQYTIDYTLNNVISFQNGHDELYWNVNGTEWQEPFNQVSVTLHLPDGLKSNHAPVCYSGSQGSTTQNCVITLAGGTLTASANQALGAGETLTYVAGFEQGYFTPFSLKDRIAEYWVPVTEFLAPVLLIGGGAFVWWWRRGRDPKGQGVIIPQYEAPDGLKPMAVGTIIDFKPDNRDITATIIDLAIRKYIKIIETRQNRALRKDVTSYSLEIITDRLDELDANEKAILNALFDQQIAIGRQVDISVLKSNFAATAKTISKRTAEDLTTLGYFRGNPLTAGRQIIGAISVIGFGLLFFHGFSLGLPLIVGLIVGLLIALVFGNAMAARTAKGVAANEHILGLKMYLEIAEKDRIRLLQSPEARYAAAGPEPARTVELFEKLLPYAMILGVEKQWAGKFADIYKTPPDWYNGNWTTFNTIYLASVLSDGIGPTVNQAFSAPSSSSGSGFGGGGFSGGGGGGGGGGGW